MCAQSCDLDCFAAAGLDRSCCVNALYSEGYYLGAHNGRLLLFKTGSSCIKREQNTLVFLFFFGVVTGLITWLRATTAGQRLIHAFNPPTPTRAPVINWWVHQLTLDCMRTSRLIMRFPSVARTLCATSISEERKQTVWALGWKPCRYLHWCRAKPGHCSPQVAQGCPLCGSSAGFSWRQQTATGGERVAACIWLRHEDDK